MSQAGTKALTIVAVSVLAWYSGMKFWKPIIIEKLREEGRLRDDVNTEYDAPPTSWNDLKGKVSESIHGDDAPKPRS
ncbi:hypothetical protein DIRU0_E32286 [Diutina rugosa]